MTDFNNLDALYEHVEKTVLADKYFYQTNTFAKIY